jgi:hypothetical protein
LTPLLVEMYIASGAWYTQILPRTGLEGLVSCIGGCLCSLGCRFSFHWYESTSVF